MSSNQLGVTSSITKDDRSASPISVTAGLLARLKICDVPDAMDLILLVIKADDLEATRVEEGKGKLVNKRKQGTSSQPFCLAMVWPRFSPQTPRNAPVSRKYLRKRCSNASRVQCRRCSREVSRRAAQGGFEHDGARCVRAFLPR